MIGLLLRATLGLQLNLQSMCILKLAVPMVIRLASVIRKTSLDHINKQWIALQLMVTPFVKEYGALSRCFTLDCQCHVKCTHRISYSQFVSLGGSGSLECLTDPEWKCCTVTISSSYVGYCMCRLRVRKLLYR